MAAYTSLKRSTALEALWGEGQRSSDGSLSGVTDTFFEATRGPTPPARFTNSEDGRHGAARAGAREEPHHLRLDKLSNDSERTLGAAIVNYSCCRAHDASATKGR